MVRFLFLLLTVLLFAPMSWAGDLNLNTATASELDALPGIGPSKASAIIAHRDSNGPFKTVDGITEVVGIGPATLEGLRDLVMVGEPNAGSAAPATPAATGASGAKNDTPAATSGGAININTASATELESLTGIGPTKASAIKADRDANGPFASCADLQRVNGVGPATVASIGASCTIK